MKVTDVIAQPEPLFASLSAATTASPTRTPPPAVPDFLAGRYRILERIGEGGMGEVYRGVHEVLGRPVAVKFLMPSLSADAELARRFQREAVSAARIGQENIVEVLDFGQTENGRSYIVMEYLEGQTLAQIIKRQGAMPVARSLHLFAQVCRALNAAHDKGIIHRDLKPENVIVIQTAEMSDRVKVVDFGIAKVASGTTDTLRTQVGTVIGTPQYMSPEQASGRACDARSDVYSLGVILYEMLAGRPPFTGDTPAYLMASHIFRQVPPLPPRPDDDPVPTRLLALLTRMLAKSPEGRPSSMVEVLRTVGLCLAEACHYPLPRTHPLGTGAMLQPTTATGYVAGCARRSLRSPWVLGSGALAAAGLAVLVILLGLRHPQRAPAALPAEATIPVRPGPPRTAESTAPMAPLAPSPENDKTHQAPPQHPAGATASRSSAAGEYKQIHDLKAAPY
jgi:eukaryotic-like serine/threonine-protein kinase